MSKDTPKNEQQLAEAFIKEYTELCEKHGMQIQVTPAWKSTNHGSFETVLQTSVGKLPSSK